VSDSTFGELLQEARKRRRMPQRQLAERTGLSIDHIGSLEQGRRHPRMSTIYQLADALGVPLSVLLGCGDRLDGGENGALLRIRDALIRVDDLEGIRGTRISVGGPHPEPVPLGELAHDVRDAWVLYWQGRLGVLAALLPMLLRQALATDDRAEDDAGRKRAARLRAQVNQLTANVCVHVGDDNLAFAACKRGMTAAARSGDELQHAVIFSTASWVLLHMGRLDEAEELASSVARTIEAPLSAMSPPHLTVYGSLMLTAVAPAAAARRLDEVRQYLGFAGAVAALEVFSTGDRHDYWTNFGQTQVGMQRVHAMAQAGKPAEALRARGMVRLPDLLPISQGSHHLDLAQAYLDRKQADDAITALQRAQDTGGAEWARQQGPFRTLVGQVTAGRVLTEPLKQLQECAGMRLTEKRFMSY
jgi:transcriptional regulator with XRE-family HTH domain